MSEEKLRTMEDQLRDIIKRLDKVEGKSQDLSETVIRHDERYKTILDVITNLVTDVRGLDGKVSDVLIRLTKNDVVTKQTKSFVDAFTIQNIIAVIVGIMMIIAQLKG